VIQKRGRPERRYFARDSVEDERILWLNPRTIVLWLSFIDDALYAVDAESGRMTLLASLPGPLSDNRARGIVWVGVSPPHRVWYRTVDGETHDVTIKRPTRK
jgi:hypothetical protein